MKNLTVHVIANPNGKTQITTTPMGNWLDTPEANAREG